MLNPLIHKLPCDTLHHAYCVLHFIDTLPDHDGKYAILNQEKKFGYFCIMQLVKDALRFEYERTRTGEPDDDEQANVRGITEKIEAITSSRLKARLLAELEEALYICS